jgi:hypothetical protein
MPHSEELQPQQSRDLRFAPAQDQAKEIALQLRVPPRSLPDLRFAPAQDPAKEIGLQLRMPLRSLPADWRQPARYLSLVAAQTERLRAHRWERRSAVSLRFDVGTD